MPKSINYSCARRKEHAAFAMSIKQYSAISTLSTCLKERCIRFPHTVASEQEICERNGHDAVVSQTVGGFSFRRKNCLTEQLKALITSILPPHFINYIALHYITIHYERLASIRRK